MAQNKIGARAARSTLIITLIIIVSKLVGFVREMVFAAYFGTGAISDAYTNANSVVNILILLFSACISSTFIPIYLKTKRLEGPGRGQPLRQQCHDGVCRGGHCGGGAGVLFCAGDL